MRSRNVYVVIILVALSLMVGCDMSSDGDKKFNEKNGTAKASGTLEGLREDICNPSKEKELLSQLAQFEVTYLYTLPVDRSGTTKDKGGKTLNQLIAEEEKAIQADGDEVYQNRSEYTKCTAKILDYSCEEVGPIILDKVYYRGFADPDTAIAVFEKMNVKECKAIQQVTTTDDEIENDREFMIGRIDDGWRIIAEIHLPPQ